MSLASYQTALSRNKPAILPHPPGRAPLGGGGPVAREGALVPAPLPLSLLKGERRGSLTPRGIRIPVASMKGRCPRPLDDGGLLFPASSLSTHSKEMICSYTPLIVDERGSPCQPVLIDGVEQGRGDAAPPL